MGSKAKGVRQGSNSVVAPDWADLDKGYTTEHQPLRPEGSSTMNQGFEGTSRPDERTDQADEALACVLAELAETEGTKETGDLRSGSVKRGLLPLAFWRAPSAQMCWIPANEMTSGSLSLLDLATSGARPLEGSV